MINANPIIACACGCGTQLYKFDNYKRPRRCVHGHNRTKDKATLFFEHTQKTDTCWLWTGSKTADGYGRFGYRKNVFYAHQFSYELHKGPIPKTAHILHDCDNPSCVNPDHLRVGNHLMNMHDAMKRGRLRGTPLSDMDIRVIRALNRTSDMVQREIGALFGVCQSAVSRIVNHKARKQEYGNPISI